MTETLEQFAKRTHEWLNRHCEKLTVDRGSDDVCDDVAVFHSRTHDAERAIIGAAASWQRTKYEAGFGAIDWPAEFGGCGLSPAYAQVFTRAESSYRTPPDHELRRITVNLVAPTVRDYGTAEQHEKFVRPFLRCDQLACQLFSEPSAGSDLAGLGTRAVQDGPEWVLSGTKVWVSGAQFADWGLLLARTDPEVPKHAGITAFLVPLDTAGVEARPIRQMTGGTSFNEVFFNGARIPDELRLGEVGDGWRVALSMLAFERGQSGSRAGVGASWEQLRKLAVRHGKGVDTAVRDRLVRVFVHEQLRMLTRQRADETALRMQSPGPEGSLGKLLWVQGLLSIGDAASAVLGPQIVVDTGVPGTYNWSQHLLGAPGYRIAGGTDEVQRNILAERVLGLPAEPRTDRHISWRELPRS